MCRGKETPSCGWLRHSAAVVAVLELVAFGRRLRGKRLEGISGGSLNGKLCRHERK